MDYFINNSDEKVDISDISEIILKKDEFIEIVVNQPLLQFYEKLEQINNSYGSRWNEFMPLLQVTKTLMWKAGTYDRMAEWIARYIFLTRKQKNIGHMIERAYEKANRLRWTKNEFIRLEQLRSAARRLSLTTDPAINEKTSDIIVSKINKLTEQIDKVNELFPNTINMRTFYVDTGNWIANKIYLSIVMANIEMNIFDGNVDNERKIGTVKYESNIVMHIECKLIDFITGNTRNTFKATGYTDSTGIHYPYISSVGYRSRRWGAVCFETFRDQIMNSFINIDLEGMSFNLLAWSKYYHYTKSQPYNRIDRALLGYPKTIGDLYPLLAPGSGWSCFERINQHNQQPWTRTNYKDMSPPIAKEHNSYCDQIECLFKDKCEAYKTMVKVINNEIKPPTKEELDMELASFSR